MFSAYGKKRVSPVSSDNAIMNLSNEKVILLARVPENHPRRDAEIPQRVVGHEVDHGLQLRGLMRLLGIQLVQAVEPRELEELLGEEEGSDGVGVGAEEGEVLVVHIQHVGAAEHAVLLRCEVDEEGGGRDPFRGADGDAHFGCLRLKVERDCRK